MKIVGISDNSRQKRLMIYETIKINNYVGSPNSIGVQSNANFSNSHNRFRNLDPGNRTKFNICKNIIGTKDYNLADESDIKSLSKVKDKIIGEESKTKDIFHKHLIDEEPKIHSMTQLHSQEELEKLCRICLENEQGVQSRKLITPCFCIVLVLIDFLSIHIIQIIFQLIFIIKLLILLFILLIWIPSISTSISVSSSI